MEEKFDMLEEILSTQKAAQEYRGFAFPMEGMPAAEYIKTHTLHCIDELCEMLHEIKGYKEWKRYDFSDAASNAECSKHAKEELIDAIHFMLNIALALGMSAKDIHGAFMEKSRINYMRLENAAYKKDTEA